MLPGSCDALDVFIWAVAVVEALRRYACIVLQWYCLLENQWLPLMRDAKKKRLWLERDCTESLY